MKGVGLGEKAETQTCTAWLSAPVTIEPLIAVPLGTDPPGGEEGNLGALADGVRRSAPRSAVGDETEAEGGG